MIIKPQYWSYGWLHIPTCLSGQSKTLCPMSHAQFLSCLAHWNTEDWKYWPERDQYGILAKHECQNISEK